MDLGIQIMKPHEMSVKMYLFLQILKGLIKIGQGSHLALLFKYYI